VNCQFGKIYLTIKKEVEEMVELNAKAKEIGKEILISGIMAGLIDLLRDVLGKKIPERIGKKFEEYRDEMMTFIQGLDDRKASKNLWSRWKVRELCQPRSYGKKEPYKHGDEINFVERLTRLYKSLDEPQEHWQRVEVFKWLGRMEDEEFDLFLEFLNHDLIMQWFKRSWLLLKEAWGKIYSTDPQNIGIYQKALVKIGNSFTQIDTAAGQAAPHVRNFRRWLERKGVR